MPLEMIASDPAIDHQRQDSSSSTTSWISARGWNCSCTTEGYAVDLAQNGTEGLRKLESGGYDLVLLDLMMPDISGMEVLERSPRARPRDADLHDHGLRLRGSRRQRLEAGRERLLLQALGQRKADHRDRPHDRAAAARNRRIPSSAGPSSSATAFPTSSARASAWCACSTWWDRWPTAGPPS